MYTLVQSMIIFFSVQMKLEFKGSGGSQYSWETNFTRKHYVVAIQDLFVFRNELKFSLTIHFVSFAHYELISLTSLVSSCHEPVDKVEI